MRQALEIVANYGTDMGKGNPGLILSGTFRGNKSEGTNLPDLNTNLTDEELEAKYVDRGSIGQFETGMPNTRVIASATYTVGKFSAMIRGSYFGEVVDRDTHMRTLLDGSEGYADQVFDPQNTIDLGITYDAAETDIHINIYLNSTDDIVIAAGNLGLNADPVETN